MPTDAIAIAKQYRKRALCGACGGLVGVFYSLRPIPRWHRRINCPQDVVVLPRAEWPSRCPRSATMIGGDQ
jgi:hypothetical protein